MSFEIVGLKPDDFSHLFLLSNDALAKQGIERCCIDEHPGYPDRIGVREMQVGETALLLNYEHLPVNSPYRSRHAIYVSEQHKEPARYISEVPVTLTSRILSMRAFDAKDCIIHAELATGDDVKELILQFFEDPDVSYIHAHFAKRGCFAAEIRRTNAA